MLYSFKHCFTAVATNPYRNDKIMVGLCMCVRVCVCRTTNLGLFSFPQYGHYYTLHKRHDKCVSLNYIIERAKIILMLGHERDYVRASMYLCVWVLWVVCVPCALCALTRRNMLNGAYWASAIVFAVRIHIMCILYMMLLYCGIRLNPSTIK